MAKVKEGTVDAEMEAKKKQLRLRAKVKTETTDAALKQTWMAKAKERVLASAANARSKTAPMRPQTFRIPPRASPVRTAARASPVRNRAAPPSPK